MHSESWPLEATKWGLASLPLSDLFIATGGELIFLNQYKICKGSWCPQRLGLDARHIFWSWLLLFR